MADIESKGERGSLQGDHHPALGPSPWRVQNDRLAADHPGVCPRGRRQDRGPHWLGLRTLSNMSFDRRWNGKGVFSRVHDRGVDSRYAEDREKRKESPTRLGFPTAAPVSSGRSGVGIHDAAWELTRLVWRHGAYVVQLCRTSRAFLYYFSIQKVHQNSSLHPLTIKNP